MSLGAEEDDRSVGVESQVFFLRAGSRVAARVEEKAVDEKGVDGSRGS